MKAYGSNKVQGIIMDWAGTAVDYGCMAPVQVFSQIFREAGMEPTLDEVRAPMGLLKRDHIRAMLAVPRIAEQFRQQHGRAHTAADIERLHAAFEPQLLQILHQYAEPIADVLPAIAELRQQGLKIGGTTGYNDAMMQIVARQAQEYGYAPDYWLTPDAVHGKGRPYPYMIYANIAALDMGMPWQVLKVGDTAADIEEARNAGVWAVGVIAGSSTLGLSGEEARRMDAGELAQRKEAARRSFLAWGAHDTIETLAELPPLVEQVNARIGKGERPCECTSSCEG